MIEEAFAGQMKKNIKIKFVSKLFFVFMMIGVCGE